MPHNFDLNYAKPLCSLQTDIAFLLEIISDFKQILTYMPSGNFPSTLRADITFETEATMTENIVLSLQGTVIFLYQHVYNEPYPTSPTPAQIVKINDIWVGIGHPENIIPT